MTASSAAFSARTYREAEILSASPSRLLMITFDGLLASLARARVGLTTNRPDVSLPAIGRAQAFVGELLATLDHVRGGKIAGVLSSIYVFTLTELQALAGSGDVKRLDAITALMQELRDAFATITAAPRAAVA
ncbi:MAG: flagellar export chaperone FliS [Gemmatimonadaceae bacterium]